MLVRYEVAARVIEANHGFVRSRTIASIRDVVHSSCIILVS